MASGNWFGRLRGVDIRLVAAIGATLLLIFAIAVTLPNGPDSGNVIFDPAPRHDISHAERVELDKPIESRIMREKDAELLSGEIDGGVRLLTVHVNNESKTFIPKCASLTAIETAPARQTLMAPGANLEYAFPLSQIPPTTSRSGDNRVRSAPTFLMVSVVS